jgi:hypothetical protein
MEFPEALTMPPDAPLDVSTNANSGKTALDDLTDN